MKLTKRQLNKKLGSKVLKLDGSYTGDMKDVETIELVHPIDKI